MTHTPHHIWRIFKKAISRDELIATLRGLPKEIRLYPNDLNNIAMIDKQDRYVGYLEFWDGQVDVHFLEPQEIA